MILCILKGVMPFKMHKILFFFQKKIKICVLTLPKIFRPVRPLPETNLSFLFGLTKHLSNIKQNKKSVFFYYMHMPNENRPIKSKGSGFQYHVHCTVKSLYNTPCYNIDFDITWRCCGSQIFTIILQ